VEKIVLGLGHSCGVGVFGSFATGFRSGSSDVDLALTGDPVSTGEEISLLNKIAMELPEHGFGNVTKIFQASIPLLKFTDVASGCEIDFCVSNDLGRRNSAMLNAYCKYDCRAVQLGRLFKDWARSYDLVHTQDGCLNSYTWCLLAIFYLQLIQPPVLPNLQQLATESNPIRDIRRGTEDVWETKFHEDIHTLPPSQNTKTVAELLVGLFHFFGHIFSWRDHAVCIRLNRPGIAIDRFSLVCSADLDQWYIEDPFDLKHNLAAKCTPGGREQILRQMRLSLQTLVTGGSWRQALNTTRSSSYFLKTRVSRFVSPADLIREFQPFGLLRVHMEDRGVNAFLEFPDADSRRRAHTKNESYIADCQLQLLSSTQYALADLSQRTRFSTHEASDLVGGLKAQATDEPGVNILLMSR
jgi:hypothetical protein